MASSVSARTSIDPANFATLPQATRRYRINDPTMTNEEIAARLGLQNTCRDYAGEPGCCFWERGSLVAIRTESDVMSIFHVFQMYQVRMEQIGGKIVNE